MVPTGGNSERESSSEGAAPAVVPQRAFESLLADLDLPQSLTQALRAAGYEVDRPRAGYPVATWLAANQAVRRHLFPHLGEAEGLRALGRRNTRGFRTTPVGEALQPSMASLSAERFLARLPRLFAVARPDVRLEVHFLGERDCRIEGLGINNLPDLLAGALELVLEELGRPARVELEPGEKGVALRVRW